MKKITIILMFFFLTQFTWGQMMIPVFIEYNNVLTDIKNHGKESKYFNGLDYEAMLYLDKACFNELQKVNPNFLENIDFDTIHLSDKSPEGYVHKYKVEIYNIQDLFTNTNLFNKISSSILGADSVLPNKIGDKVYVKGIEKAYFTLYGQTWSNTYRATLRNNELKIECLHGIIE